MSVLSVLPVKCLSILFYGQTEGILRWIQLVDVAVNVSIALGVSPDHVKPLDGSAGFRNFVRRVCDRYRVLYRCGKKNSLEHDERMIRNRQKIKAG